MHLKSFVLLSLAVGILGCKKDVSKVEGNRAVPAKAAPANGSDTILFGHVASLTGEQATFGLSSDEGIRLAVEEQNARGLVRGKKIAVKTYDDQGKSEEAAIAATRLIVEDKVTILLGEVASTRSLAFAPIADEKKVPMISPSSTNPSVTKIGGKTRPYVFRVCFIDPFQGTVMAKFVRNNLKLSRVAILKDVGNDYSVGLADYFAKKFVELGGTVISEQSYKDGDQDFKAQLTQLRSKKPEFIYVPGYYTSVALIARQARQLGIKAPFGGGDGWDSAKLYEIAQGALNGSYFSNHYSEENQDPLLQNFIKNYKAKYGAVPDALAGLAYDSANLAIDAIERAKDMSPEAIRQAIEETKGFRGATGTITMDADHNPVKPADIIEIRNNRGTYNTTVEP